ncbi:MAG: LysR family transcriptional regulator [Deltaproteobacteria bacterium]|nr:LysR family transcriptional regulator [Deltaproteobacteria bacterium]
MHGIHLRNADLNLLVVLRALLETRSVTQAAAQLGVSQSATSHALSRLRVLFADPLLVRSGRGMTTTPRADALEQPLGLHLDGLELLLRPQDDFDVSTVQRTFRIAGEDYFSTVVLPNLLARVAPRAPGVVVEMLPRSPTPERGLANRDFDLHVGVVKANAAEASRRQVLFTDDMVCVLRHGHPAAGVELDVKTYAELDHVMVGVGPRGPTGVDDELARRGLERRIGCRVGHFVAAPAVVAETDMVLTLPRRLAQRFCAGHGLTILETPLPRLPFQYAQFWHAAMQQDPGHRWFRTQVRLAAA